jgi:hypothetical protein
MRVGSRVVSALAAPLIAAAIGTAACGGGSSPTTTRSEGSRSTVSEEVARPKPAGTGVAWSQRRLLRRLAHAVVGVEGRRVRLDRSTLTCDGEGAGSRHGRHMAWARFTCIQPTFGAGQVAGPDAVFVVEPTGPRTVRISGARFTRY